MVVAVVVLYVVVDRAKTSSSTKVAFVSLTIQPTLRDVVQVPRVDRYEGHEGVWVAEIYFENVAFSCVITHVHDIKLIYFRALKEM